MAAKLIRPAAGSDLTEKLCSLVSELRREKKRVDVVPHGLGFHGSVERRRLVMQRDSEVENSRPIRGKLPAILKGSIKPGQPIGDSGALATDLRLSSQPWASAMAVSRKPSGVQRTKLAITAP